MKNKKTRALKSPAPAKANAGPAGEGARKRFVVDETKLQKIAGGRLASN